VVVSDVWSLPRAHSGGVCVFFEDNAGFLVQDVDHLVAGEVVLGITRW
jgi:hypothetical protein